MGPPSSREKAAAYGGGGQSLAIYATGLGAVSVKGQYTVTNGTVTATVNGAELPVAFAGLTPGYIGLYRVNVVIPAGAPSGLGIPLTFQRGGC